MSTNDITGDKIITKVSTDTYRNNYDMIFKKTKPCAFCAGFVNPKCEEVKCPHKELKND